MTRLQIRTGIDRCAMRRTGSGLDTSRTGIVPDRRAVARTGVVRDSGTVAGTRTRAAGDGTRTGATIGVAGAGATFDVAGTRTAVDVAGARAVAAGDGGAGAAGRARDARPVVRPTAPRDAAAMVAVALRGLAAAHAGGCLTAADAAAVTAVDLRCALAAADARRCLTAAHAATVAAAGLRSSAAADAAVGVAAGRRHLRSRPAVPRGGAVLRSRRVGRTTAGTTTLALCLKRGGTHHYDAKHQYHFYKSFHLKKRCFQ